MTFEFTLKRNFKDDLITGLSKSFPKTALNQAAADASKYVFDQISANVNPMVYNIHKPKKKRTFKFRDSFMISHSGSGRESRIVIQNLAYNPRTKYPYPNSVEFGQATVGGESEPILTQRELFEIIAQRLGNKTDLSGSLLDFGALHEYSFGNMPPRPIITASAYVTTNWLKSKQLPSFAASYYRSQLTGTSTERFVIGRL